MSVVRHAPTTDPAGFVPSDLDLFAQLAVEDAPMLEKTKRASERSFDNLNALEFAHEALKKTNDRRRKERSKYQKGKPLRSTLEHGDILVERFIKSEADFTVEFNERSEHFCIAHVNSIQRRSNGEILRLQVTYLKPDDDEYQGDTVSLSGHPELYILLRTSMTGEFKESVEEDAIRDLWRIGISPVNRFQLTVTQEKTFLPRTFYGFLRGNVTVDSSKRKKYRKVFREVEKQSNDRLGTLRALRENAKKHLGVGLESTSDLVRYVKKPMSDLPRLPDDLGWKELFSRHWFGKEWSRTVQTLWKDAFGSSKWMTALAERSAYPIGWCQRVLDTSGQFWFLVVASNDSTRNPKASIWLTLETLQLLNLDYLTFFPRRAEYISYKSGSGHIRGLKDPAFFTSTTELILPLLTNLLPTKRKVHGWKDRGEPCAMHYFGCMNRSSHTDHIIPQRLNGSSRFRNLQRLCEHCHTVKNRFEDQYLGGRRTSTSEPFPMSKLAGYALLAAAQHAVQNAIGDKPRTFRSEPLNLAENRFVDPSDRTVQLPNLFKSCSGNLRALAFFPVTHMPIGVPVDSLESIQDNFLRHVRDIKDRKISAVPASFWDESFALKFVDCYNMLVDDVFTMGSGLPTLKDVQNTVLPFQQPGEATNTTVVDLNRGECGLQITG